MKTFPLWENNVFKDKTEQCLWDLSFSPDGTKLVTVGSNRVWVYDVATGSLLHSMKGHNSNVVCCAFYRDGSHFATGSLDKQVIIWNSQFEGILKYSHDTPVFCLAFSPAKCTLLSGSGSDIGLWTKGEDRLSKRETTCKATCCSWSSDGEFFAVGLDSGVISIRNKLGEEKISIDRTSYGPISSLDWYLRADDIDVLAVVDLSQTLSFYRPSGKMISREKQLGFDPCFVRWHGNKGEHLIIGGSNKKVNLYSREGNFLNTIVEKKAWVWSAARCPKSDCLAVCSQDGILSFVKVVVIAVHSFYKERYAYRDCMTDVIIRHLATDKKVKVKNKDLVKKVAVYNNKLLIQCGDVFNLYESPDESPLSLQYKFLTRFTRKLESSITMICSLHIILFHDVHIQCFSFDGTKQRDWTLASPVRYARVMGGPAGREGLLVGSKNGQVMLIFLDNPLPITLLQTKGLMRCLDLNSDRTKLAVVDEHYTCLVFDLKTKELLYQEPNASSVAWNNHFEDMICFTFNGVLGIKSSTFPIHQQKQEGFVVAFNGPNIYCLNKNSIRTVSVPYSAIMYQYLEQKLFNEAYKIACMGVTSGDWQFLGREALESLDVENAKKSFIKTQDVDYLDLIADIEERMKRGERNRKVLLGDILALEGRYDEAASTYRAGGMPSKAVEMYTDLRMFNLAKDFLGDEDTVDKRTLMAKQADWATDTNDLETAAQMYINAGEMGRAIDIIGQNGWAEMLINLTRKLDKGDRENLTKSAKYLEQMKQYAYAAEIYQNMEDIESLVKLQVTAEMWEEAMEIVSKHPQYKKEVYYPYALWLAESGQFEEAQEAFQKAGMMDQAVKVLEQLTKNAVMEKRFLDAAYYEWRLSMQFISFAAEEENSNKREELLKKFTDRQRRADIYYAYHPIQRFMEEPFTFYQSESLFNISRYLVHYLSDAPLGMSQVYTLYTLAKQCHSLGAFKLARWAYDKFKSLVITPRLRDAIDMGTMKIRSKPFSDSEELSIMCYFCSSTNPLFKQHGNRCINCKQPFVFSFVYFEVLPMIEFVIEDDITDGEAVSLIELEPPQKLNYNQNSMQMNGHIHEDPFTAKIKSFEEDGVQSKNDGTSGLVVVDRVALRNLSLTEVVICQWPPPLKNRYYKIALQDVPIVKCDSCNRMFHKDDYEELSLQMKKCPFCRKPLEE